MEKVKYGDTVKLHYLGKLNNGNIFVATTAQKPLCIVLGSGTQLPAFERSVVGMRVGTMRKFIVRTNDAYGPRNNDLSFSVKRNSLSEETNVKIGDAIVGSFAHGIPSICKITKFDGQNLILDGNHPLAGEDLTFVVQLLDIVH